MDFKKLPVDPASFKSSGVAAPSSTPALDSATAPGTAVFAAALEEEDADLEALGLPAQGNEKKKKLPGPKAKRSREEMLADEVRKVHQEWNNLLTALGSFPDAPKAQELARVERMMKNKHKDLRDAHEYDQAQNLNKVLEELDALRQTLKPTQSYTTGTLSTRKKSAPEFWEKMRWLKEKFPAIFSKYPANVKVAFHDLHITKLMEQKDWPAVGEVLTTSLADKDIDHVDIFERMIGIFLKQMDPADPNQCQEVGLKLHEAMTTLAQFTRADVKADMMAIAAVVGQQRLPGEDSLEHPLAACLLPELEIFILFSEINNL